MRREVLAQASDHLARQDPRMAALIQRAGPCGLRAPVSSGKYFAALTEEIAYQQLAGKAAAAIYGRFRALFDGALTPEAVLQLPEERMRATGLSRAKTASIRDLAAKVADGSVPLRRLTRLSDEEIITRLSAVRGIGRWTAEMFLIFEMGRLDVWPVDDYGVRKGYARIHGLTELPTPKQLAVLGDPFKPYRSAAAWYCWKAVDTTLPTA